LRPTLIGSLGLGGGRHGGHAQGKHKWLHRKKPPDPKTHSPESELSHEAARRRNRKN
jgi:hypothetical protein